MRKKLNLLLGLVFIISMAALTGCGGSGKAGEKNPYEGKWVAVSAQMMGISVSVDETFGGDFEFEVKNGGKVSFSVGDTTGCHADHGTSVCKTGQPGIPFAGEQTGYL